MTKKIIFYTRNLSGGGAEKVIVNLSNEFVSRGLKVEILLDEFEGSNLNFLEKEVSIRELNANNILSRIVRLAQELRINQNYVLCTSLTTQNLVGYWASLLARRPNDHFARVAAHHSASLVNSSNIKKKLVNILFSKLAHRFNFLIAVSESVRQDLVKNFGVKESQVVNISNPYIETKKINRKEVRPKPFGFNIVSVGRLVKQKNFSSLISCFGRFKEIYPDSSLTIVGVGPEEELLKNVSISLGVEDRVFFPGYKKNVIEFLEDFDLFILPSLWEGSPNVILDALKADLPIICSDSPGGSSELLNYGEHGTLVRVNDDDALLNSMIEHKSGAKQKKISTSRIKFLERFHISEVADNYLKSFGII